MIKPKTTKAPETQDNKIDPNRFLFRRGPRVLTEEHKAKLIASNLGKIKGPRSEAIKAKISKAMLGKKKGPMSEEHKAKISKARRDRSLSETTKTTGAKIIELVRVNVLIEEYEAKFRIEKLIRDIRIFKCFLNGLSCQVIGVFYELHRVKVDQILIEMCARLNQPEIGLTKLSTNSEIMRLDKAQWLERLEVWKTSINLVKNIIIFRTQSFTFAK